MFEVVQRLGADPVMPCPKTSACVVATPDAMPELGVCCCCLQNLSLLRAELLPSSYVQLLLALICLLSGGGEYPGVRGLLGNRWLASWGYAVLLQALL